MLCIRSAVRRLLPLPPLQGQATNGLSVPLLRRTWAFPLPSLFASMFLWDTVPVYNSPPLRAEADVSLGRKVYPSQQPPAVGPVPPPYDLTNYCQPRVIGMLLAHMQLRYL